MSFASGNSERNTTKNCAKLFLLACAMVNISKERKRENSLRENVKSVDALHVLSRPHSLFSISLSNAWYDKWAVLSGLETTAHCIKSGFLRLQKEAKTRQWKAMKNILKVNWIQNKNIWAAYARKNNQALTKCKLLKRPGEVGRGGGVWGGWEVW